MKSRICVVLLVFALLFTLCATPALAASFEDTECHWAADAIDAAVAKNLFQGTSATTFSPDVSMSRGMFVTVLGRFAESLGINVKGSSYFYDVSASAYYAKYVAWAADYSIVKGVGYNYFAPDDPVTREQMCALFVRFLHYAGYSVPAGAVLDFVDAADISSYALEPVSTAVALELITGSPAEGGMAFRPAANATRAEVATVFLRLDALEGIHDLDISAINNPGGDDDEEARIAEYLTVMVRQYENMNLSEISPKGLEALDILMGCVRDALDAREKDGVKLTREYVMTKYADSIDKVKDIFKNQMSRDEKLNLANKALEFSHLTTVLSYFGISIADLL